MVADAIARSRGIRQPVRSAISSEPEVETIATAGAVLYDQMRKLRCQVFPNGVDAQHVRVISIAGLMAMSRIIADLVEIVVPLDPVDAVVLHHARQRVFHPSNHFRISQAHGCAPRIPNAVGIPNNPFMHHTAAAGLKACGKLRWHQPIVDSFRLNPQTELQTQTMHTRGKCGKTLGEA